MIVEFASFLVAAVLLILLPGPDSLVVLRGLSSGGRAGGIRTSAGVICGLLVWIFAAVLGLSALLQASEVGFEVLKIVGGIYLVWMGVQSLRAMRRDADVDVAASGFSSGFVAGFLTDVLNPKIGILFVTLLPGFVPDGFPVALTTFGLGMAYLLLTVVYFAALVVAAGRISAWMRSPRIRRRIDGIAGLALLGFGVRLATE
ncbi:LysE family translocator [Gordonia sp. TBRC 11910]|uniref:LysE family translocator n=1 Tax=Gordonia asplenii TaxID=2725283 RepID=A0A848L2J3_9ACTN|nr:LysE family translocator [Gordonia asplenii]NMO02823.1 LysE family translocator [Gordonia asplenii]